MKTEKKTTEGITRRDALKISGLALGELAFGGALVGLGARKAHADDNCTCDNVCPQPDPGCTWDTGRDTREYSYFKNLKLFHPFDFSNTQTTIAPLGRKEMRITFMGSCIPPVRRAQQMMSIFVEVGWDRDRGMPLDQFVFDCGSGVCANYGAMNVGFGRMNKIFLTHLHGDHMSDLTHIYCFGPSADRKSPLYVFGPGPSGVRSPRPPRRLYDDGTKAFCENLRAACRWHSESFSFETTSYPESILPLPTQQSWGLPCNPVPVGDDPDNDAYAMIPIELDWTKYGKSKGDNIAYWNKDTGVKITHFPVIHTRKGSIGYKLEWTLPGTKETLSMIYTGDTKPEIRSRDQAINGGKGVDVFIHEMVIPAQIWAMKNEYFDFLPPLDSPGVENLQAVQNSSHSPQGAFGYLLSTINPRPRLTVATHFPVADDTVACAMKSVQDHFDSETVYQGNDANESDVRITWSFDLMVIKVSKDKIVEKRGKVSDFGFSPWVNLPSGTPNPPKYWTHEYDNNGNPIGDPYAQIDTSTQIPACDCDIDPPECNYREDGY